MSQGHRGAYGSRSEDRIRNPRNVPEGRCPAVPEIYFLVRWPDGERTKNYSPSLVVQDYFTPGTAYPPADFLARSREALTIASDLVRAKYGMGCAHAQAELAGIERRIAAIPPEGNPTVLLEGFES